MNPFEMVVMIVAIVAVAGIIRAKHGIVRNRHGDETYVGRAGDDAEAIRLRGEVQQLKQRIQVLERIVTDGDRNRSAALEREIDALRIDKE